MVGHGLRRRQVRGPGAIDGAPATLEIDARRYRCRDCGAIIEVVPRGVVSRRHFRAEAIAIALWLYGVVGASAAEVHARVVGCGEPVTRMRSIGRWLAAIARGSLFGGVARPWPDGMSRRAQAERVARALAATVPFGATPEERLVLGAAQAA